MASQAQAPGLIVNPPMIHAVLNLGHWGTREVGGTDAVLNLLSPQSVTALRGVTHSHMNVLPVHAIMLS